MLAVNDYITGVDISQYIGGCPFISYFAPTITIKGLEYLETNPIMKRFTANGMLK